MCGIAGIFAYSRGAPAIHEASLLAMRERMRARGPDAAGTWISPNKHVGLAHRRLSIIDLSDGGRQPMADPETGNQIVFNGEIYNYKALRCELEAGGHRFISNSDTEVVLRLYRVHGLKFVEMLRGMFAIGIFDAAMNRLVLARDPFGIKPLYIANDGKTIRFASQVKALLAGGSIDLSPSAAGHAGYFLWGSVPEPHTLYRAIRAVPAGTVVVTAFEGTASEHRYFDIAARVEALEPFADVRSAAGAQAVLSEALRDSVRHHLVADVPVGVFLSAGLDSCTLAGLSREVGTPDLKTLTIGFSQFQGTEQDEVPIAEAFSERLGSQQITRWISGDDFHDELDLLVDAMDQPSIDGVNTYFVCKAAQSAGLKVALSGVGGDELFDGYADFASIPKLVSLAGPLSRLPGLGAGFRRASSPIFKRFTSPKYAGLIEYGGDLSGAYLLNRALYAPWELADALDPQTANEGLEELGVLKALRDSLPAKGGGAIALSTLFSTFFMRNQLLRDTDWASMAHSLEIRTPLIDVPLWETVIRLSLGGYRPTKQDMAASPTSRLPEAVLRRPKTGFSIPVRDWLSTGASAKDNAHERGLRGWAQRVYQIIGAGEIRTSPSVIDSKDALFGKDQTV
jgi:asparagine synthase (glutamine-hydrolysing)